MFHLAQIVALQYGGHCHKEPSRWLSQNSSCSSVVVKALVLQLRGHRLFLVSFQSIAGDIQLITPLFIHLTYQYIFILLQNYNINIIIIVLILFVCGIITAACQPVSVYMCKSYWCIYTLSYWDITTTGLLGDQKVHWIKTY